MAQNNRDKEYWLIPKRANLHQSIVFINGVLKLNYNLKSWSSSAQDRLGSYLGKNGATNDGKNISPQSVRTLVASIPQYFGFLYIDPSSTPNRLVVTDAGKKLIDFHKDDIATPIKNLKDGPLINFSQPYLKQFEKLQITNPIILKDCENVLIFPLSITCKLLLELDYLDIEELAYIVFSICDNSELVLAKKEIENFRKIDIKDRTSIINEFKNTYIGNISLVQAPSTSYYIKLLTYTGLFETIETIKPNPNNSAKEKIKSIKIVESYINYVKNYINNFDFNNTYDFKKNLDLWIDYIGDTSNLSLPRDILFTNKTDSNYILQINYGDKNIFSDLMTPNKTFEIPMFLNKMYDINFIDLKTGKSLLKQSLLIDEKIYNNPRFDCEISCSDTNKIENIDDISNDILLHTKSKNFDSNFIKFLTTLEKLTGNIYCNNKNLRGGRLEFLFFKLLTILKDKGLIDDIYWNGKIGQYGLPVPAPGGKNGNPDIVFIIDNQHFLLELTTIKSKTGQWTAEGSSVPDHVNYYAQNNKDISVTGIFVAPTHYERVINGIDSQLKNNVKMLYFTDADLIEILKKRNRKSILDSLNKSII